MLPIVISPLCGLDLIVGFDNLMEGVQSIEMTEVTVVTMGNTSQLSLMNIQDVERVDGNYTCRVFNRIIADAVDVTTVIDVICKMCVCVCSVALV